MEVNHPDSCQGAHRNLTRRATLTTLSDAPAVTSGADDLERLKDRAADELASRRAELVALSHAIHGDPEVGYTEVRAAGRVAELMRAAGFAVEVGAYGLATAVEAVAGEGDLTVVVAAEYDALPEVGHACGHNIIAAAGVGAALALASVAREAGLRVKLLGTPAEEHGGGKVDLLLAGAWEDAALSVMVHGMSGVDLSCGGFRSTAVDRFSVTFGGVAAHAAGAPDRGVNAGAAATLALTAIGLLRQHLPSTTNINAFVSHGGDATNIVPDRTEVQVEVRAYDLDVWRETKRRVLACFEGAAIGTGCTWTSSRTEHPYAPMIQDAALAGLWDTNLAATGREIAPGTGLGGGSTDMGNVSHVVPSIHPTIAVLGSTAVPHHPGFAAGAATPAADDAAIDGATVLAWTVLDAALDPALRADLLARQAARPAGATRISLES
jgi:amidohydrolase